MGKFDSACQPVPPIVSMAKGLIVANVLQLPQINVN